MNSGAPESVAARALVSRNDQIDEDSQRRPLAGFEELWLIDLSARECGSRMMPGSGAILFAYPDR